MTSSSSTQATQQSQPNQSDPWANVPGVSGYGNGGTTFTTLDKDDEYFIQQGDVTLKKKESGGPCKR